MLLKQIFETSLKFAHERQNTEGKVDLVDGMP